jgi:hypothetical protein
MRQRTLQVGRVLRASTRTFTVGCAVTQPNIPDFGSFVRVGGKPPQSSIYGLITDVSVEDDPFVRQLISAGLRDGETVLDNRQVRQSPIEVSVLAVGYSDGGMIRHGLPAQPPATLDWLYACTAEEIVAFTTRTDYFRLVLEAQGAPVDELLAASLRSAAAARAEPAREAFLVEAGRELARLLAGDPVRLEGLLRRLHP